jgi:TP901 family phage tail tape measure protein
VSNFYGELLIRITSDTAGLSKGLQTSVAETGAATKSMEAAGKRAKVSWERVGLGMQNVGRTMSQFVTIPIAAGFAFAAYSGYKYEKTLLQIRNLTGLTAAETVKYGDAMLNMSKYGIGPQKLAESMYFISSSGFKASEALKVLDVAAKASASGMGEVQPIADVLTSAMNAYGHSNLSAARATDILMKTIEVGKAEPQALATSLGRIMPVAAKLGVPLGQVGGAIAGLTLTGLSAAESVTSLRGTMIALSAPAKMSIEQLKKMGLSYQDVTRSIKQKGLLATMEMLYQKTDGNMLAMRKLVPNVRALNGILSLLGPNYKKNVEITQQVINSNGKLAASFKATSETPIQKFRVAIASIQASFTKMGIQIMPTIAAIVSKIGALFDAVGNLSPGWRAGIMWAGAFVAALGPIIMVAGSVIRSVALIKGALSGLSMVQGIGATTAAFKVGGMAEGFASLLAVAGPVGIALAGIAVAAAAVYGATKLFDWLDGTTARIGAMRTAAEAMKNDNSIKEWTQRNFGGSLEAKGKNDFVFKPSTKVDAPTNLLAKWVKTSEAEAQVAQREGEATRQAQAAKGMVAYYQQELHETQAAREQLGHVAGGGNPYVKAQLAEYDAYIASLKGKLTGAAGIWRSTQDKLKAMKPIDQAIVFKAKMADVRSEMSKVEKEIAANAKKPHSIKMQLRDEALRQRLSDLRNGLGNLTRKSYYVRLQLRAENLNKNLDLARKRLERLKAGAEGGRGRYDPKVSADISKLEKYVAQGEKRAAAMKAKIEGTIPKIDANNAPALAAINAVIQIRIPDKTFTIRGVKGANTGPDQARGGVHMLAGPTQFLAGEAGREIAAFFPLNDPARSAGLLAQLNAMMGGGRGAATAPVAGGGAGGGGMGGGVGFIQNDIYLDGSLIASSVLEIADVSEDRDRRGNA